MTGHDVSGSDMPNPPWTARQDVPPAEEASLAALLAGRGLPAGADAELRPVADVLVALTARAAGDELTGLAAAAAEFRRQVVPPARARRSPRRRPGGLASRLGAMVAMGLVAAAAVAYAGALPASWQQLAHRTIGAPAHRAGHGTLGRPGAAGSVPHSRHPAPPQMHVGARPAGRGFPHHARPPHHAVHHAAWPFSRRGRLPSVPSVPGIRPAHHALLRPARTAPMPTPSASENDVGLRGDLK
jgi:hypothetical protein